MSKDKNDKVNEQDNSLIGWLNANKCFNNKQENKKNLEKAKKVEMEKAFLLHKSNINN